MQKSDPVVGALAAVSPADQRAHFDWTLHAPEEVGMSSAGLGGVRSAIQQHIDSHEQLALEDFQHTVCKAVVA